MTSEIDELRRREDRTDHVNADCSTDSPAIPHDNRSSETRANEDAKIAELITSLEGGANGRRNSERSPSFPRHRLQRIEGGNRNVPFELETKYDIVMAPV